MHDMPMNGSYPGLVSGLDLREVRELISQDYFKFSIFSQSPCHFNKRPMHSSRVAMRVTAVVVLPHPDLLE